MHSNNNDIRRSLSGVTWAGLLVGGAIACLVTLGAHVPVMSALKTSAHLLSIRLERATGCDQHGGGVDTADQGAQATIEAYIHVCVDAPGSTARGSYLFMLDLEKVRH
jgi:hypothetical protein